MGPVSVCGPRPGKSVRVFLICSIVVPGTTWLWLCIMVSSTTVSPEFTRSTGGWALSNQPHWGGSSVAGRRGIFLPFGKFTTRSGGWAGCAVEQREPPQASFAPAALLCRESRPRRRRVQCETAELMDACFPPDLIFSNYCTKYRPLKLVSAIHRAQF